MKLSWSERAWDDYLYWQQIDQDVVTRINALIKDAKRGPFDGIGKPEPLRNDLKGWWSRRITNVHRFVYRVTGQGEHQTLEVAFCRYHYTR